MPLPRDFATRYGPWAVVTGASAGLGAEFARQLAAEGLSVVLVARRLDKLEALSTSLREAYPVEVRVVEADLSTPEAVPAITASTAELDVGLLVNNAGVELHGSFFRDSAEAHERLIAVNVAAVTALAHAYGPRLVKRGRGGILFVSSVASRLFLWLASYAASKAFVTALALILREELVTKGVDVMALEPGPIRSEMQEKFKSSMDLEKIGLPHMTPEQCVREGLQGLAAGKARTTPGWLNRLMLWFMGMIPSSLLLKVMGPPMAVAIPPEYRIINA